MKKNQTTAAHNAGSTVSKLGSALSLLVIASLLSTNVFAAGGLDSIQTLGNDISTFLTGLGAVVVTIAIMWCGYIMLFSRGNTGQIPYILAGGVIIGGAAQIANFIIT